MNYVYQAFDSPIGLLTLIGSDRGLAAVLWPHETQLPVRFGEARRDARHALLAQARRELDEYFARGRRQFDVLLDVAGTPFQRSVWDALRSIPFGQTRSYGQIAGEVGRPRAVRAVGAANGRNPIPIIVPCHRVIGADGTLTGFAGGLEVKARLLALECHPGA